MEDVKVNVKKEEITISFDLMNELICCADFASQFEADKNRTFLSKRYSELAIELHDKLDEVGYYDDVK